MLAIEKLRQTASARLFDAKALFAAKRYDGTYYLCGFAVELALKARICQTLHWAGFPESNKEFEQLRSLKVHDLATLLRFTGLDYIIKSKCVFEWSIVSAWDPAVRYKPPGTKDKLEATMMLDAATLLLRAL